MVFFKNQENNNNNDKSKQIYSILFIFLELFFEKKNSYF